MMALQSSLWRRFWISASRTDGSSTFSNGRGLTSKWPVVDLQNKSYLHNWDIFFENGLKTQEFTCTGNIFELFYLHKTNSACICAGKTPVNRTLMSAQLIWLIECRSPEMSAGHNSSHFSCKTFEILKFSGLTLIASTVLAHCWCDISPKAHLKLETGEKRMNWKRNKQKQNNEKYVMLKWLFLRIIQELF